jgi:hypothetical protein
MNDTVHSIKYEENIHSLINTEFIVCLCVCGSIFMKDQIYFLIKIAKMASHWKQILLNTSIR